MFELKSLSQPKYDPRVAFIQHILKFPKNQIDGKFGPLTEQQIKEFQQKNKLEVHGKVDKNTGKALKLPFWDDIIERKLIPPYRDSELYEETHIFKFHSKQSKNEFAYFSGIPDTPGDHDDPRTYRSIRTNNPGALGYSGWHKEMQGFVGTTQSYKGISTAIYLTPENGIAAWYTLITEIYDRIFDYLTEGRSPSINVKKLAKIYGGLKTRADDELTAKDKKVLERYLDGWLHFSKKISDFHLEPDTEVHLYKDNEIYALASSMFSHEASILTPISPTQISAGISIVTGQRLPITADLDIERLQEEESRNSQWRYDSMLHDENVL